MSRDIQDPRDSHLGVVEPLGLAMLNITHLTLFVQRKMRQQSMLLQHSPLSVKLAVISGWFPQKYFIIIVLRSEYNSLASKARVESDASDMILHSVHLSYEVRFEWWEATTGKETWFLFQYRQLQTQFRKPSSHSIHRTSRQVHHQISLISYSIPFSQTIHPTKRTRRTETIHNQNK